jgi:hypothetical protein
MAVMVVLMAILLSVSSGVLRITGSSHSTLDSDQRARTAMDAVEGDMRDFINQYGYTVLVANDNNNNTSLTFLARNRGPSTSGTCRCIAVSYRLDASSGHLMRSYTPILWSDTNPMITAANNAPASGSSAQIQSNGITTTSVIADSVLRFEAVPVLSNGQVVSIPSSAQSSGSSWCTSTVNGTTLTGTEALVLSAPLASSTTVLTSGLMLAVAALDPRSYKLPSAPSIASALPTPNPSGTYLTSTPYGVWSGVLLSGSLAQANSYPLPAIQSLRLLQDTIRLR